MDYSLIDWKAIIALLALILSQFPPIKQMIKGKKLRAAIADLAQFTHVFGNTNLSLWIDFENIGGKHLTIRKIDVFLKRRETTPQRLSARTYWITESFGRDKAIELPLAEIALKPGDRWSGFLHFWDTALWSKANESIAKSIISRVRDEITSKAAERDEELASIPISKRPLVEISPELQTELNDLVKVLRKLEEAEYEMFVAIYEGPEKSPLKTLGFDFALFQNDIHEIFEDINEYKHGFGVHLASTKTKYVQVRLRSMNDGEVKRRFKLV